MNELIENFKSAKVNAWLLLVYALLLMVEINNLDRDLRALRDAKPEETPAPEPAPAPA